MANILGLLNRAYKNGLSRLKLRFFDETHLVIDIDNTRILDFQRKERVKHANFSSSRDFLRVGLKISGGEYKKTEIPRVILQNPNGNCRKTAILDNLECMRYRSPPKGWIPAQIFMNYLNDWNKIQALGSNGT